MTQTIEIDVAYVNPPQAGRKMGSVKTKDGEYYSVWPDKLGLFTPGTRCIVEYDSRFSEDGQKEFKTIKRVMGSAGATGRAPAARAQAPLAGGAKSTAEEMFVMGVIGKALQGSGTIPDALTVEQWVRDLVRGWRGGFTSAKPATPEPPFNDEVPF